MSKEQIKANYEKIRKEIDAISGGRKVMLLGATKMQSVEDINYLVSLGVDAIAENRVNELLEKYDALDKSVPIHFIGTLQKNKVKYICDKVCLIHSVDSFSLAEEIDKKCAKIGKTMDILIEVNSGEEENKSGVMPKDVFTFFEQLKDLKNINVKGIMTMAPRCETKEEYMKYFTLTKEIFDTLFKDDKDAVLSMGMSESYKYATEAGATIVRVGTALFGERKY